MKLEKSDVNTVVENHIDFTHLHVHTEYSLLDGASRVKKLIAHAKELGMKSIAITDHGTMYGTIAFYKEALKQGIKPIIGCEVYVAPKSRFDNFEVEGTRYYHLILLAENNKGYQNLIKLVSLANIEGMYYKPRVDKDLLRQYHEGIICLSSCIAGEIPQAIIRDSMERAEKLVQEYVDIFGKDNFFLEIQNHQIPEEAKANKGLISLAQKYDLKLVATNDIHYIKKEDNDFHDVLLCIQTGRTLDDKDRMKFYNDDFYLKSGAEMLALFKDTPEAITNTLEIANRCNVSFEFGHLHLPNFPLPEGMTDEQYLHKLCKEKIHNRYAEVTEEIQQRLDYELSIINRMGYDSYFLIVWDFINFARSQNIAVGPGRGSAAGSIVAYILGITDIDPLKYSLLFERFLNPERVTMPDIDIDFCYIRRDEVIEYVKRRYGDDHVAQIITFGTMAAKGAVRDVGRVMNMPYNEVLKDSSELLTLYQENLEVRKLIDFAKDVEGMPRHSSTHAAGVVISKDPVTDYVPIQISEGTFVTQYDKDCVEELGLLKMDFLGLRTLTVIQDTIELVKANRGIDVEFDKDMNDSKVYKLWQDGNSVGIFQFESQGMTNFMKELKPDCLEDIIAGVSLYRPGPMDQIPRYIANKKDPEHAVYTHPALKPILEVTYGCMVYQEQVMQIVRDLAGYSLGRADLVRRAMGKKKLDVMAKERENFIHGQVDENGNIIIKGCVRNGIDEKSANKIFDEMAEFAKYAFNKSHAACYAVVAYRTAYLKAYYPVEFMAAMLNSFLGNLDKIPAYTEECKRLNIQILKPDINKSYTKFTVDGDKIRFGLGSVKNVGTSAVDEIVAERDRNGQFKDFTDFCERIQETNVNKKCIESLIKAGAFDEFNETRRTLMESFESILDTITSSNKKELEGQVNMFDLGGSDSKEMKYTFKEFPEYSRKELLFMEKEMLGLYISGHPLDNIRHQIEMQTNINSFQMRQMENTDEIGDEIRQEIKDGQMVKYAGIITKIKKKYTKNNKLMAFLTVEDLYGPTEIILFESAYQNCANVLMEDNIVLVNGRLSVREDEETKIVANQITEFATKKKSIFILDVTSLDEKTKVKLKGAIKFFTGDRNNMPLEIINNTVKSMAGGIYITPEILKEFQELIGTENAKVEEVE